MQDATVASGGLAQGTSPRPEGEQRAAEARVVPEAAAVPEAPAVVEARGVAEAAGVATFGEIVARATARYTTVGEMVYELIREAILTGVFQPGEHLRQDAIAETIGVSRMPVRSALLQLESEGLVSFHPHRGAMVRALSPDQVREIYEIRTMLEGHALRRAIETMTPARLERLQRLAEELDRSESGDRFAASSIRFYRELYDHERHPLLVEIIERLHGDVGRYWLGRRVLDAGESAHTRLLAFARSRDRDGAVEWLAEHLQRVADELAALVAEQWEPGDGSRRRRPRT